MIFSKMVGFVHVRRSEKIDPMFIEKLQKCFSVVWNMEVLKTSVEECISCVQYRGNNSEGGGGGGGEGVAGVSKHFVEEFIGSIQFGGGGGGGGRGCRSIRTF